ncbi:hypothetical protein D3C77_719170 [compost metagenome]
MHVSGRHMSDHIVYSILVECSFNAVNSICVMLSLYHLMLLVLAMPHLEHD